MDTGQAPNLNTSLSSLALLSLRMGEGHDYLDYLHGFVIEALHHIKVPTFDAAGVQTVVYREFGLKIPVATFAIFLKRLQTLKVVERTPDGHQFRILNLPATSITGDRQAAMGRIAEVIQKLQSYVLSKYGQKWDDDQAAAVLTDFVRDYSIDFVRFTEFRSPLPDPGPDSKGNQFIVASFIRNCAEAASGVFDSVQTLVQSHILANALLCPDLKNTGTGFRNVTFLVDTRLLLKAFDLEATIDTENTVGLLESVRRLKGVLCVFPETKDEIQTVLRGIIRGFQQGGARGPVVEELRKRGRGVADVILAANKIEEYLKRLNVSTLQSPPYDERTYTFQIDEEGLRTELGEELGYALGRAADHDVHAVRSIFALRRNRRVSRIEDAGYVFVTTNAALSRAAFHQGRREGEGWIFSAVITDFHLSHLVWLISPGDSGNLARTEILSSCYAAMRPPQSVWRKYLAEVDRLRAEGQFTEQDYEVLRLSLKAPEELMEVTQGEIDGITESNLRTILNRLEKTYAADKEEKLKQERLAHEATMKALTESEREKTAVAEREKAFQEQQAFHETEIRRLKDFELEAKSREETRAARINRIAHRSAKIAFIVSGIAFAVIVALAVLSNWSIWLSLPAAVVSFFNLWSGFSGNTIERAVKRWVARRLASFMS